MTGGPVHLLPTVTALDVNDGLIVIDGATGEPKRILRDDAVVELGGGGGIVDLLLEPPPVSSVGWVTAPFFTSTHVSASIGATVAASTTTVKLTPIIVTETTTFDQIAVHCGVAATDAGAAIRLAVYESDAANNRPGTLIVDAGTVACTTTGLKSITFGSALTLDAGLYWLALTLTTGGTTAGTLPTFYTLTSTSPISVDLSSTSATMWLTWVSTITAFAAFPSTLDLATLGSSLPNRIGLKVA